MPAYNTIFYFWCFCFGKVTYPAVNCLFFVVFVFVYDHLPVGKEEFLSEKDLKNLRTS
jgi:hypothetical protein